MALTRRLFATRFGQLHVRSTEGKGIPLVLLHPSPRSGEMWEPLQERLTRPTYAPDRLGYGFSDAPPWALSLEQYAQCTVDAMKAAGVEGAFDVLGMHVGSVEAVEIAHQAPAQVRRVIAVGVPIFTVEEQQRQMEKASVGRVDTDAWQSSPWNRQRCSRVALASGGWILRNHFRYSCNNAQPQ